jgi:glutathione S-transferase
MMRLIIGNKNYSSWSLRAWLPLKHLGTAFEEERIALFEPGYKQRILAYSPGGKGLGVACDRRIPCREISCARTVAE